MNFEPEPDLTPLYPSPSQLTPLLSPLAALTTQQKFTLVCHSLTRACAFGDFSLLSFLLADPNGRQYVDLTLRDENGTGLLIIAIGGFGMECERDVEREECIRLLVSEGADVNSGDNCGWTALHHASLLAPPTLVSFLLTHGADVLVETHRKLTALDIIRAHSPIPGREDISILLEEAMREKGWQGSRLDDRRHQQERRAKRKEQEFALRKGIARILDLQDYWWGKEELNPVSILDEDDSDEDEWIAQPLDSWSSMLVYSPHSLPHIFQVLITDFKPALRNPDPARSIYLLCRFACLWGDPDWLEDLIAGAVDRIEEAVYALPEDLPRLTFWLFNCTMLLHLLRCDNDLAETIDILGLFGLLEELLNAIFVFIIRTAERHIDPFIEASLLDYISASSDLDGVQFESEWAIFRSLQSRKRLSKPTAQSINASIREINSTNIPPISPVPPILSTAGSSSSPAPLTPSSPGQIPTLKQSLLSSPSSSTPTQAQFKLQDARTSTYSPRDLTSFLSAFHSLLVLSGVNPVLIAQAFSQILYWTSCEMFNRILTRKKYLCRSRAGQVMKNIMLIESWTESTGLPPGVASHFSPVRELLHWLQSLSSLDDFATLVSIIQSFRNLNPFQMRRAVKDYRYEIGESRMSEECAQYLAQLQKDWERHRVKVGVESMRKEFVERERNDSSPEPNADHVSSWAHDKTPSLMSSDSESESFIQHSIDKLFDTSSDMADWLPPKPPPVLGELLESRYMLPLVLPSDPQFLCAISKDCEFVDGVTLLRGDERRYHTSYSPSTSPRIQQMRFRMMPCKLNSVTLQILSLVDGSQRIQHRKYETEEDRDYVHIESDRSDHLQSVEEPDPEGLLVNNRTSPKYTTIHPIVRRAARDVSEQELSG